MAFGLSIKNTHGSVQIDETYRNLSFIQKGTVSLTASAPYSFTLIGRTTPVVALSTGILLAQVNNGGGSFTYTILPTTTGSCTWYLFDVPPASSPSGFGLLVRDATGNVTFRSDYKYMKLVDTGARGMLDGAYTYTGAPGRSYAAAISGGRKGVVHGIPGDPVPLIVLDHIFAATASSGNQVTLSTITMGTSGPYEVSPIEWDVPYTYHILDVTGL